MMFQRISAAEIKMLQDRQLSICFLKQKLKVSISFYSPHRKSSKHELNTKLKLANEDRTAF